MLPLPLPLPPNLLWFGCITITFLNCENRIERTTIEDWKRCTKLIFTAKKKPVKNIAHDSNRAQRKATSQHIDLKKIFILAIQYSLCRLGLDSLFRIVWCMVFNVYCIHSRIILFSFHSYTTKWLNTTKRAHRMSEKLMKTIETSERSETGKRENIGMENVYRKRE